MVYYGSHSEIKFQASISMSAPVIYTPPPPPYGSSLYVSAQEFTDHLLTNIYDFQHLGKFIICGDFNSRIGDMPDFIEGVDAVT